MNKELLKEIGIQFGTGIAGSVAFILLVFFFHLTGLVIGLIALSIAGMYGFYKMGYTDGKCTGRLEARLEALKESIEKI